MKPTSSPTGVIFWGMKMQIEEIISETIESTVKATVDEFQKRKLVKKKVINTFKKTEQLLYNYNAFLDVVKDKKEMIEQIQKVGLSKRSGSFIPMPEDTGFKVIKSEDEKENEAIETLENSIETTERFIKLIDNALETISNDPYFEVVKMHYFQGMKYASIADKWPVTIDESTICRNKNRLVKKMSIYLFSDEVINEMLNE